MAAAKRYGPVMCSNPDAMTKSKSVSRYIPFMKLYLSMRLAPIREAVLYSIWRSYQS